MNLQYFIDKKLSFALIKGGKVIYKSKKQRLAPLLFCLRKYKAQMRGALVFDKVVGRAAALFLIYGGVKKVITPLTSRDALAILKRGGAAVEYQKMVKNILNKTGDDLCPMEKKSRGLDAPELCRILGIKELPELVVKRTKHGTGKSLEINKDGAGAFASRNFKKGEKIIDFNGPRVPYKQMPSPYSEVDDHYVQIGKKLFMGPSGGIDDYVNHSCDPNSGLIIKGKKVFLIAIRNIKKGEEIVWDYSTTMYEAEFPDKWEMDCDCGSPKCRKRIVDFKDLPERLQQKYIKAGVVPGYIIKTLKFKN